MYHGLSWTIMDYHGLSWTIMDYYLLLQAGPKIGLDIGNGREITGFLSIFNDQDHVEKFQSYDQSEIPSLENNFVPLPLDSESNNASMIHRKKLLELSYS